mgnify:CR=1 FL=1
MDDSYKTTLETTRDLDVLGAEAVGALRKFLALPEYTSLDIGKARVAASALSAWTRNKQTESARETNFLILARELANDKAEFRRFVQVAMPSAPVLKALSDKTTSVPKRRRRKKP